MDVFANPLTYFPVLSMFVAVGVITRSWRCVVGFAAILVATFFLTWLVQWWSLRDYMTAIHIVGPPAD